MKRGFILELSLLLALLLTCAACQSDDDATIFFSAADPTDGDASDGDP